MLSRHLPCTGLLRDLQGSTRKGLRDTSPFSLQLGTADSSLHDTLPVVLAVGTSNVEGLWGRLLFVRAEIKVLGW